MIITVQSQADRHELKLQGRLDANWADLVAKSIETAIRAGHHEVDLDFAEVSYISSAGIRILLKYAKQLKAARGALRVVRPTDAVLSVIRLSGLAGILLHPAAASEATVSGTSTGPQATQSEPRRWQQEGVDLESYELPAAAGLEGHVLGRPEAFANGQLSAAESQRLRCMGDTIRCRSTSPGPRRSALGGRVDSSRAEVTAIEAEGPRR